MPSKKDKPEAPGEGETPPPPSTGFEARAKTLNTRGTPYQWDEYTFPAGDWVKVSEEHVERLKELPWLTVRKSDGSNSPAQGE